MFDDQQRTVTREAGARVDDLTVGGRTHRGSRPAADLDTRGRHRRLPECPHDVAIDRPAPAGSGTGRARRRRRRPAGRTAGCSTRGPARSTHRGRAGRAAGRREPQALADPDQRAVAEIVPAREILVPEAVAEGDGIERFSGADHVIAGFRSGRSGRRRPAGGWLVPAHGAAAPDGERRDDQKNATTGRHGRHRLLFNPYPRAEERTIPGRGPRVQSLRRCR